PNFDKIASLRRQFNYFYNNFNIPGRLIYDKSYDDLVYNMSMNHVEIQLFDKMAVGYNIFNNYEYEDKDLTIIGSDGLRKLMKQGWVWRSVIMGENANIQILKLVRIQDWKITDLYKQLMSLGISIEKAMERLAILRSKQIINIIESKSTGKQGRPPKIVTKGLAWIDFWTLIEESIEEDFKYKENNELDNATQKPSEEERISQEILPEK
ncbi:MAG: hypothetical protein AABY22_06990, partial [Nanoarchaeota archaeon]